MSHEAEKQFSQTKGYRQGGIFSLINANDVTAFPPAHMGRAGGGAESPAVWEPSIPLGTHRHSARGKLIGYGGRVRVLGKKN